MATILITRPEHDFLTRCVSRWSDRIINEAKKRLHHVIDLHKEKANKVEFESRIKKLVPALILLNGHGDETCVSGHDNQILVKDGENEYLLKKKITYAVACLSGKVLGVACADSITTYIGYDEPFILNLDRRYLARPLSDERARRFLEPSNLIALSLLKGHSAKEASENSKRLFRKNIVDLLKRGGNDVDVLDDVKDLYWNMTHQICLGNVDAKL